MSPLPALWSGAGLAFAIAVVAGLGDRRRRKRRDVDAVGWVDWRTVQFLALIALAILVSLALNLR